MRFGVHLTHYRPPGADEPAVELAQQAEALGFDSVWAGDHIVNPEHVNAVYPHDIPGKVRTTQASGGMPDPFVLLAVIGGLTTKVRLGFDVLIVPYRPPLLTAKQFATLDALTGGRVIAGIGVGWHIQEFEALGVPYPERGARTDEAVEVWQRVWSGENVAFEGKFTRFEPLRVLPRPLQAGGPPIWLGGDGPRARQRAAKYGHGWIPTFSSPERYAHDFAEIKAMAARLGRPTPTGATQQRMQITDDRFEPTADDLANPYCPVIGNPDQIIAKVRAFAEAGVEEFVLSRTGEDPANLERLMVRFSKEIMPAFR